MMGRREDGQGQFFYSFDLDKVVPPDHLVRQIDDLLDLSWVHKELGSASGLRGCSGNVHCDRAGWGRSVLERCEPD